LFERASRWVHVQGGVRGLLKKDCWIVLLTVILSFSTLFLWTIRKEGMEVLNDQRGFLILRVYSKAGCASAEIILLQENLNVLEEIDRVISISPEEAISKIIADPGIDIDRDWLSEKSSEVKNKSELMPWGYECFLNRWDEETLNELSQKILDIEAGSPPKKIVSEVFYDKALCKLVVRLEHYIKWLNGILIFFGAVIFLIIFQIVLEVRKIGLRGKSHHRELLIESVVLGALSGILSQGSFVLIASVSFFESIYFSLNDFGGMFLFQMGVSFLLCSIIIYGRFLALKEDLHNPHHHHGS
jgi:hypothetical protein